MQNNRDVVSAVSEEKTETTNELVDRTKNLYFNLALNAKVYARKKILAGSTHLKNNNLEKTELLSLVSAALLVRQAANEENYLRLEPDHYVYSFERTIAISAKYSMGNCSEYAKHALDYFLTEISEQNIEAEVFEIINGDHLFLVVGRLPNSDPNDPKTWGAQAVICDPWADEVYYATEYLTKLKCYKQEFSTEDEKKHQADPHYIAPYTSKTVNFDPVKNKLQASTGYTVSYLKKARNIEDMKNNLIEKLNILLHELKIYQDKLKKLLDSIIKKYGLGDSKANTLQLKINEID